MLDCLSPSPSVVLASSWQTPYHLSITSCIVDGTSYKKFMINRRVVPSESSPSTIAATPVPTDLLLAAVAFVFFLEREDGVEEVLTGGCVNSWTELSLCDSSWES